MNEPDTPAPSAPVTTTPPPLPPAVRRPNWPFWVALGLIALPGPIALFGGDEGGMAAGLMIAPLCGIASGILLGIRLGNTTGLRILLSIIGIFLCIVASEGVAAAGCAAGNFSPNVH